MNLEALAQVGEIVGAVAVVVSLIYLAVQVRQNTRAQQTENYSRALERISTIQAALSQDPDMAGIISKGVADPAKLTPRQRLQFTWAVYELLGAFEFMFMAARTDSIPDEIWRRWAAAATWWLSFPGIRTLWDVRPIPFADSFTEYVDTLLADTSSDAEATRRYQDFIARGEGHTR